MATNTTNSIADNWKALSGEDNWKDLLTPTIDNNLRRYLCHYGERQQAILDGYNTTDPSKSYAFPRYPPEEFFSQVSLQNGNPFKYQVTKYFYFTSENTPIIARVEAGKPAWAGYVAVTTEEGKMVMGRTDIMVCWTGTMTHEEWIKDANFLSTSAEDLFGKTHSPRVHGGFHELYTTSLSESRPSARIQVLNEIRNLVDEYLNEKKETEVSITIVGHSLGAAIATMNAMDIVFNGYNKSSGSNTTIPVTAFAFASPQVGNAGFKAVFDSLSADLRLLRIVNAEDIVPTLPKGIDPIYVDVGKQLDIDSTKSPYLKVKYITIDILGLIKVNAYAHNLEVYLHTIAGYKGDEENFELVIDRDYSLVNKFTDALIDEKKIPNTWWVVKNWGMLQMDNGFWHLNDYVPELPTSQTLAP